METEHVNAMTKKADTRARPVILNGIPRYQVAEQSKYWPDLPRFSTVDHFFSAFENIIRASGHDVNLVWKQYIPISLPFDLESWKENDLLPHCNDWDQAKALFRKHFGTLMNAEESMAKLFSMRMEDDDTLQNYTNQFMKHVKECGFPVNNNLLARFYQFTLPAKNKQLMVNQMSVRHNPKHQWTINEIYECVLPLFLADEQNRGGRNVENHRGKRKTEAADGSRTKATRHPIMVSSVLSMAGAMPRTTLRTKPREPGHTCREFYAWKQERETKRNINVHTVKVESTGSNFSSGSPASGSGSSGPGSGPAPETNDATGSSTSAHPGDTTDDIMMNEVDADLDAIDAEEASLDCKFTVKNKHESFNPFQLLTPIILESKEGKPVRLIAKIDTGSDSTFLNKNVFHHKLLFTSQDIISVEGNLNFFSHSMKRLGKSPAIRIRYLNDISFDHSYELANSIQDLGDFDVLLGVDILSRLRIELTGIAHKFADLGGLTEEEKSDLLESVDFEDVNLILSILLIQKSHQSLNPELRKTSI